MYAWYIHTFHEPNTSVLVDGLSGASTIQWNLSFVLETWVSCLSFMPFVIRLWVPIIENVHFTFIPFCLTSVMHTWCFSFFYYISVLKCAFLFIYFLFYFYQRWVLVYSDQSWKLNQWLAEEDCGQLKMDVVLCWVYL